MARHLYRCPLRWSDMDAYGHVNNVLFLRYLEEARIDLMFRLAPSTGSATFSGGSVVARHEVDYLRPLTYQEGTQVVLVEIWVTKISAASITLAYEIKAESEGDKPCVRASSVAVAYNLEEGRPRRITPEEKAFLEKYLEPAA